MIEICERVLRLPPDPSSAAQARQALRELLSECGRLAWLDAAELAVSELVTNVVLHAHTALVLRARCGAELRVEVCDESPAWPTQRGYGEQATTGRGMGLVAAVTSSHGIAPVPTGGKTVWFVIDDSFHDAAAEQLGDWSDLIDELTQPQALGTMRVLLRQLPSTLWLAAEQRHDALLRELALDSNQRPAFRNNLAAADGACATLSTAVRHELAAAEARGDARHPLPSSHPARLAPVAPTVEVELFLSPTECEGFAALQDVLDEAEQRAAAAQMLSRPGLPEVVALRDWACEQIIAQINGQDPSPWPGTDAGRFTDSHDHDNWPTDWDSSTVSHAQVGLVAADDRNRIIAVSGPLAAALGWDPDELIGRRVVAIVPPRFREAHVAGFTRHLTTGQAHALGVELELPVLKADGTELVCIFMI
ncbi:MAG: putative sensor protein, partial [Frankiales bacterium]|nr:putative sensor protein [Frankiales bacterium]